MTPQTLRALVRATAAAALVAAGSAAGIALSAAPATAQPPQGAGGNRQMMPNMLFDGITLTDAQKTRIDSIRADFRAKAMAERGNAGAGGPPDSATMAARRERMQTERTALRATLTAEQQATFDKNVQAMEERMRTMRQRGAGAPPR